MRSLKKAISSVQLRSTSLNTDFKNSSAYRQEFEVTAQASMSSRLALKLAYLLRYSNDPVPGFKKTDNTTTASVVLRWKAATPAPAP